MRDWRVALEAGINKEYGGNKPLGYSNTKKLVEMVASILDDAGFVVVTANDRYGIVALMRGDESS